MLAERCKPLVSRPCPVCVASIVIAIYENNETKKQVEDEQRHLGALEDTFQQIKNTTGLSDVDDIIDR